MLSMNRLRCNKITDHGEKEEPGPGSCSPWVLYSCSRAPQHRCVPLSQHAPDSLSTETVVRTAVLCHHVRRGISTKNVDSCFIPKTNVKSTVFQMRLGVLGRVVVDPSAVVQIKNVLKIGKRV